MSRTQCKTNYSSSVFRNERQSTSNEELKLTFDRRCSRQFPSAGHVIRGMLVSGVACIYLLLTLSRSSTSMSAWVASTAGSVEASRGDEATLGDEAARGDEAAGGGEAVVDLGAVGERPEGSVMFGCDTRNPE